MTEETAIEYRFRYGSNRQHTTEAYRDRSKLYREWKSATATLEYRKVVTSDWEEVGPAAEPASSDSEATHE